MVQFEGACGDCGQTIASGVDRQARAWAAAAVAHYDVCPEITDRERLEACRARQRDVQNRKKDEVARIERRYNKRLSLFLKEDIRLCAKITAEEAASSETRPTQSSDT